MRRFFLGLAIIAALGVVPCKARGNDRQIAQKIVEGLQEYKEKGELKGINIDLQVEEGAVYLKGQVASTEQEELAVDVARHIEGVTKVYNELEIIESKSATAKVKDETRLRPTSIASKAKKSAEPSRLDTDIEPAVETEAKTQAPDSRELAQRIYARLKDEKDSGRLKGFALDLEVEHGVAWLKGTVATAEQQSRVLEVVRRVPGVTQVVNGITITSAPKAPDNLAQQVLERLQAKKNSGELKDFRLDVEVEEGIVWLSGNVANEDQRQLVLETARYVPGVVKVVNDLSIGSSTAVKRQTSQVKTVSETQIRRAPTPPPDIDPEEFSSSASRHIPSHDGAIGSSVARTGSRPNRQVEFAPQPSVPAPTLNQSGDQAIEQNARQTVQYMWVPANPGQAMGVPNGQAPLAFAPAKAANYTQVAGEPGTGAPLALNPAVPGVGIAPARFDHPQMPQYAWPSYAPYPNYGAVTYPKQYSPMAWPYIGPFYPYPQVPLGWRKVTLEWDDGWWQLDFKSRH
jgi:osmotically-inducible protein OsmY